MKRFDHPFILPLRAVAQDKRIIFMYIDFMPCGDLMGVVSKFEKLSLELTRFYAGQVCLAFEYLHHKDMIFRDLKPENVLVSIDGYL